jgi:hypothetical protein
VEFTAFINVSRPGKNVIEERRDITDTNSNALALLTISIPSVSGAIILGKRGFTLMEDEADWLPAFTPDAGCGFPP